MKKKETPSSKKLSIIAFIKFLAFILPLVIYLLLIVWFFPAPNSGFISLGVLGCFIMGIGIVNVSGLLDNMYCGHIITSVFVGCGGLLILASSLIMYTPAIYSQLDERLITFYFIIWSLLIVCGIYYLFFRYAISLDLQKNGFSKTGIKKAMTGVRNYWWYCNLKSNMTYQWTYGINKLFTVVFPSVSIVHLLFGWWKALFLMIAVAVVFLMILNFTMYWLIFWTWNHSTNHRRQRSSLAMVGGFIFPIAGCIGLVMYLFEII